MKRREEKRREEKEEKGKEGKRTRGSNEFAEKEEEKRRGARLERGRKKERKKERKKIREKKRKLMEAAGAESEEDDALYVALPGNRFERSPEPEREFQEVRDETTVVMPERRMEEVVHENGAGTSFSHLGSKVIQRRKK